MQLVNRHQLVVLRYQWHFPLLGIPPFVILAFHKEGAPVCGGVMSVRLQTSWDKGMAEEKIAQVEKATFITHPLLVFWSSVLCVAPNN